MRIRYHMVAFAMLALTAPGCERLESAVFERAADQALAAEVSPP